MTNSKIAAGLLILLAIPAITVAAVPDIIKARQANFKKMGAANKAIGEELKKSAPSVAIILTSAKNLNVAGNAVFKSFPRGSGAEAGVKTAALPAIWQKPDEFKAASGKFLAAAAKLKSAAESGDLVKIKAAAGGLGPTCKGCHDQFRHKD